MPIQSGSTWSTLLFGFGPAILLIALLRLDVPARAQQGGGMGWAA